MDASKLHTSLEEAVGKFRRRRADKALCRVVAEFQRTHLPEFLDGEPRAFPVLSVFSATFLSSEKSVGSGIRLFADHTPRLNESFAGHVEQVVGFAAQRSHHDTHLRVGDFPQSRLHLGEQFSVHIPSGKLTADGKGPPATNPWLFASS